MNEQNILNYFGRNIDVRLDSSEFYDYDISTDYTDYNKPVLDFTSEIEYDSLVFNSSCLLTGTTIDNEKPLALIYDVTYTGGTCNYTPRRRTETGWTLDFVFNKNGLDWISGATFYYTGVMNEIDPYVFADNNLSFQFTAAGFLSYRTIRYSGYCDTESGYTETFDYDIDGTESPLCEAGTSDDFNITITFERNNYYYDCDIENEGGINDLITGYTVTNPKDVMTGATEDHVYYSVLNDKWEAEQWKRLGTLRFFLNGNPIFKKENWEEVIPHNILTGTTQYQVFGGGPGYIDGLFYRDTAFEIKSAKFFEEPLNPVNVKHHYLTTIKPNYSIVECFEPCNESPDGIVYNTPTPTPTPTVTPTITVTPTYTPTVTPTYTPTITPTLTVTPTYTPTVTPTITPTLTVTPTYTPTLTVTPTYTPTLTVTPTPLPPETLVMSFNVTTSGETLTLPLNSSNGSTFNFNVDWGDGSSDNITSATDPNRIHTYASPGIKTVLINGILEGWSFSGGGDKDKLLSISGGSGHTFNYSYQAFRDCSNLTTFDCPNLNFTNSIAQIFYNCSSMTTCNVDNWNLTGVTGVDYSFYNCSSLTSLNVSNWDTPSTNLNSLFQYCSSLTNLNFAGFTSPNVASMTYTFGYCSSLPTVDISSWDISSATSMGSTFIGCASLTTLDVSNLVTTGVTSMFRTFYDCTSLTSVMPSNIFWENLGAGTTSVTSHTQTFTNATNISNYNTIPSDWGGGGA